MGELRSPRILHIQDGGRRAPAAGLRGRVTERHDERSAGEDGADDLALNADPPSVDDPDLVESGPMRLGQVLLDHGLDLLRQERMKVEHGLDGETDRLVPLVRLRGILIVVARIAHAPSLPSASQSRVLHRLAVSLTYPLRSL